MAKQTKEPIDEHFDDDVTVARDEDITPPKWQVRDDIKPIVSELIEVFPEKLGHVKPSRIGYAAYSKKKSKTAATVYPMRPMFGLFSNIDYILGVWLEGWLERDVSSKYVLVLHELLHIPEGGFDQDSKSFRKTVDHDVKDFEYVLRHFGICWEDAEKILKMKQRKDNDKRSYEEDDQKEVDAEDGKKEENTPEENGDD